MILANLADIQMGYPFRSRLEHDPQGEVLVVQMKDIDDTNLLHTDDAIRVRLPKRKAHHQLRAGDLLFRSRGRNNGAAQVPDGIGAAVLAAPMLLIRPHGALPDYLCWYINTPTTQAQLATQSEGSSVQMISVESLKALEIPLPSLEIQRRIAVTAALAAHEQTLMGQIATLRHHLTTRILMQRAHHAIP